MILLAIKRHDTLYNDLICLMTLIARENLEDLFNIELRRYLPQGYGFFKITHEYLKVLMADTLTADSLEVGSMLTQESKTGADVDKRGSGSL